MGAHGSLIDILIRRTLNYEVMTKSQRKESIGNAKDLHGNPVGYVQQGILNRRNL